MNKWLKAELDYWKSQRSTALATLELYFNDSVGIGEHSKISDEIHQWTNKLSEATEKDMTFLNSSKYKNLSLKTKALACITSPNRLKKYLNI